MTIHTMSYTYICTEVPAVFLFLAFMGSLGMGKSSRVQSKPWEGYEHQEELWGYFLVDPHDPAVMKLDNKLSWKTKL